MGLAWLSTYVLAAMVVCASGTAVAQTVRASVGAAGQQALGSTWVDGTEVSASADGSVVVFDSPVDTLVPDDHNGLRDVFIVADGSVTRALPPGVQPTHESRNAVVSGNGRFVAFASASANLTPGDPYLFNDIFLFDRQNPSSLALVSAGPSGEYVQTSAFRPAISSDGRYVAFLSAMALHVGSGALTGTRAYRRDVQTGTTVAVGVPGGVGSGSVRGTIAIADTGEVAFNYCDDWALGNPCKAYVANPDTATVTRISQPDISTNAATEPDRVSLSADGRYVSYTALGVTFAGQAIIVHDRVSNASTVVSRPLPGQQVDGLSRDGTLSADGRYVTFFSTATNLTPHPVGTLGLFRADLQALTIVDGITPIGPSNSHRSARPSTGHAVVSTAGTVVFVSDADDLVPGDVNHTTDVFRAPVTGPVTVAYPMRGTGGSTRPTLDYEGTTVAFISTAANLVEGDDNQVADAFVKDLKTGAIERLQPIAGTPLSPAEWVALSDDGRFVAFYQSNEAWLYDRRLQTTTMVSRGLAGQALPSRPGVSRVAISGDGRYVAFTSLGALAETDTNHSIDVHLFDRVTGTTRLVGLGDDGEGLWNGSYQPSLSGDGRFVSFLGVDFDSTGVSSARAFIRDRDADADGIFDEPETGATRTYLRPPVHSDLRATGASLSRDGQRLFHASARPVDDLMLIDDVGVVAPGGGNLSAFAILPFLSISTTPNIPAASASGRYYAWVRTHAPMTNTPIRPFVTITGSGSEVDLSAAANGQPCSGGHYRSTANPVISGNGRVVAYESGCVDLVSGDSNAMTDIFVTPTGVTDGREPAPGYRSWAATYALDPDEGSGSPWADTDDDGLFNLAEFSAASDPTLGRYQRYFAEGATATPLLPFTTRIALANPGADPVPVRIEYALASGSAPPTELTLGPWQRTTVVANEQTGLASAEFGFRVLSSRPIGVDRTMTWDAGTYAGHSDAGSSRPSLTWYFAEGATIAGFQLFYLLQNPSLSPAEVEVRFLLATGSVVTRRYTVAPQSRFNVWANAETDAGGTRPLANQELSAEFRVVNNVPIVAERAMYRDIGGRLFKAGHESSGVIAPASEWFLAEGNAGDFFDFFVLLANPSAADTAVKVDYLLGSGEVITRTVVARANSRTTIWVDELEEPAGSGLYPFRTGQTDISVRLRSLDGAGIVVERAMWWPGRGS